MSAQKHTGAEPHFGPRRETLIRVMTMMFVALLGAMLALGTVLVLLQFAGLIISNSSFIIGASEILGPPTYWVSAAFGTFTLLLALAHGWKSAD